MPIDFQTRHLPGRTIGKSVLANGVCCFRDIGTWTHCRNYNRPDDSSHHDEQGAAEEKHECQSAAEADVHAPNKLRLRVNKACHNGS